MKKAAVIAALVVVSGTIALNVKSLFKSTVDAYIFGYPLVLMQETRRAMEVQDNTLNHNQSLPDHNFRSVVRPNNDTLYSVSWLNLSEGPQVLSVPDSGDRYYVMPFMDAWTNVFATVGTRETGNRAGDYALVGPDWQGELPQGLNPIQSPTNMVWMIGRLQINGSNDLANLQALQQGFSLTPVAQWQQGERIAGTLEGMDRSNGQSPMDIIDNMDAHQFFSQLNQLMAQQPASPADAPLLAELAELQIGPGLNFEPGVFSRWIMNKALELVQDTLKEEASLNRAGDHGWSIARDSIGSYDTDYIARAFVSLIGLGALPPQEAIYPNTELDSDGNNLIGSNNYRLHFDADKIPPADAFWSITMYDEDGFLVDNPIKRYTIGDRDKLNFNSDGSLDIYLQHQQPQDSNLNWLPSPADKFAVTMRLYLPKKEVLDGTWNPSSIEKIQ